MRIAIVGAGAIGGTLAALLDRAGHDITIAARGASLTTIGSSGLRLTGAWGEHTARVTAVPTLAEPHQLVVFAVKAPDLADAIHTNLAGIGGRVLVVRNGLGGRDETMTALAGAGIDAEVTGGLAVFAASNLEPGEFVVTAAAPLYVGGGEHIAAIADLLSAALPTIVLDDLEGAEWTKLVVNQVNALPAITGLSVQDTVGDARLRRVLTRSMRETIAVARSLGVRFASMQGLSDRLLRLVSLVPVALAEQLPRAMARRMGSVPNQGSTLQSIRRGRRTEIDWLNGAVVSAAARSGVPAAINAALVEMVHQVESTGEFLTVDEVMRRIDAI